MFRNIGYSNFPKRFCTWIDRSKIMQSFLPETWRGNAYPSCSPSMTRMLNVYQKPLNNSYHRNPRPVFSLLHVFSISFWTIITTRVAWHGRFWTYILCCRRIDWTSLPFKRFVSFRQRQLKSSAVVDPSRPDSIVERRGAIAGDEM